MLERNFEGAHVAGAQGVMGGEGHRDAGKGQGRSYRALWAAGRTWTLIWVHLWRLKQRLHEALGALGPEVSIHFAHYGHMTNVI
jgi:hypothetical protein